MTIFRRLTLVTCMALAVGGARLSAQAPAENLRECLNAETYDPETDYFPDKATLDFAQGLQIEYHNHYKVLRVANPWQGASPADAREYVLVQCGAPIPEGFDSAQIIEVPVQSMISMSTTYLPPIVQLGLLDYLIGVDTVDFVNTPEVLAKAEAGALVLIGNGSTVNAELALEADPDVIFTFGNGVAEWDSHPKLEEVGLFVALNADWTEPTLLGRAEWMKFIAAFYNREAEAQALFGQIVAEYEAVRELANSIPAEERLTVLWNAFSPYSESWSIPGQRTWVGELLADAGLNYVLQSQAPGDTSLQLAFEAVYEAGLDAPLWVVNAFGVMTQADLLALDERYADFSAFQNGAVWNNAARVNANGGNDFFETGVTNPHLVLKDLVSIAYPELLPDYEPIFHNQLD